MVTTLLYATIGLALVLLLRVPMRRLFGAGPAFTLWLLPPTLTLLAWLPSASSRWMIQLPQLDVFPSTDTFVAQIAPSASSMHAVSVLWAAGCALCLLRLASHYRRLLRESCPLPAAMWRVLLSDWPGLDARRLRLHPAGPALLWAPRNLILLPIDFLDRFDACQRRLVLQHEHTHLRRGDALWSLLGELMLALLWFHPLAWLALSRLRLDQELACDERVLRQSPQDTSSYAHTLLHSTGVEALPMSIPWLTQPQLKERLNMIQRPRPGAVRRNVGFLVMAMLMTGMAFVTQAATGQQNHIAAGVSGPAGFRNKAPLYPADAARNKVQGTVVLLVLVGADGNPKSFTVDPTTHAAPELIKAASDAVMTTWHFTPRRQHGKAVEGYAKVPITFSINEKAPAAPPAPASSPSATSPSV